MSYLALETQYQPFSYEELIAPLILAELLYSAMEDEYTKLSDAYNWEHKLDPERDKEVYKRYKRFKDNLQIQTNDLAANGLSSNTRKSLLQLKDFYNSDIAPIAEAYTNWYKAVLNEKDIKAKDPTFKTERNLEEVGIDPFFKNPGYNFGRSVSGEALRKLVSEIASFLKTSLTTGDLENIDINKLPLHLQRLLVKGESFNDIKLALLTENYPDLYSSIIDLVISPHALNEWMTDDQYKDTHRTAALGLFDAVGNEALEYFTMPEPETESRNRRRIAYDPLEPDRYSIDTEPWVALNHSSRNSSFTTKEYNKMTDSNKYDLANKSYEMTSDYMTGILLKEDPNWYVDTGTNWWGSQRQINLSAEDLGYANTELLPRGRYVTMNNTLVFEQAPTAVRRGVLQFLKSSTLDSNLKEAIDKLINHEGTLSPLEEDLKEYFNAFKKVLEALANKSLKMNLKDYLSILEENILEEYDTYQTTGYPYHFANDEYSKSFKDYIVGKLPENGLEEVTFTGKEGFKETGEHHSLTDKDKILNIQATPYGMIMKVQITPKSDTGDLEVKTYKIPITNNTWANGAVNAAQKAAELAQLKDKKFMPKFELNTEDDSYNFVRNSKGNIMLDYTKPMTLEFLRWIEEEIDKVTLNLYLNMSNIYIPSTTKKQLFETIQLNIADE